MRSASAHQDIKTLGRLSRGYGFQTCWRVELSSRNTVVTPTSASWLNQVERWFATLTQK